MKKFNTYNGFYTKPYRNPNNSPNFIAPTTLTDSEHDNISIVATPQSDSINIKRNLSNYAHKSTSTDKYREDMSNNISPTCTESQPILSITPEEYGSEYTYTYVEDIPQVISMKTRRLMQLAKTHEQAIDAIISASNN